MNAQRVSLSDLLTLVRRKVEVVADQQYREIGVRSYGRGLFHKEPRSGLEVGNKDLFLVHEGDFILQVTFAWEGAVAVAKAADHGLYGSVRMLTFCVYETLCLPEFLQLYFRTPEGVEQLVRISPGSAGRNRVLNKSRLSEVIVPLPPLAEQRRIVAKIERLAGKIEEARRVNIEIDTDLKSMLTTVFHRVIDGAELIEMKIVAPLVRRSVELEEGLLYPEVGIRSFGKGTFQKPALDVHSIGTKRIFRIEGGDLLLSNVFAWEGAIAVAKPEDHNRYGSHRFISCVPEQGVATSEFLCFYFLTPEGLAKVADASPGGAGRNRTLGLAKLERITVPVPDYHKQTEFNRLQAKVRRITSIKTQTATELDALLPAILDRAFKGKL